MRKKLHNNVSTAVLTIAFFIIFFFSSLSISSETQQEHAKSGNLVAEKGFSRLLGEWRGKMGDGEYVETWTTAGKNAMHGEARMLNKEGKTVFKEEVSLQQIGGHVVYIVIAGDNHPVLFTLIQTQKTEPNGQGVRWVFENKEHDFPQRIVYHLETNDKLTASIEGTQKGEPKKTEFPLVRSK